MSGREVAAKEMHCTEKKGSDREIPLLPRRFLFVASDTHRIILAEHKKSKVGLIEKTDPNQCLVAAAQTV